MFFFSFFSFVFRFSKKRIHLLFVVLFGLILNNDCVLSIEKVNGKKYIPSSPKTMVGFLIKRTDVDSTLFLEDHQHSPASCLFQNDKIVNVAQGDKIVPITGDARQVQDFTIGKN